jgi:hypothetical protein
MKSALLGIAAASVAAFTLSASPAKAGDVNSGAFVSDGFVSGGFIGPAPTSGAFPAVPRHQGWGVRSRPGWGVGFHRGNHDGHGDGDHRHHDRNGSVFVDGFYDNGAWAYYNNRSFEPDSFNGWWHDDPHRAYPAWVQRNREHCDRMWWSGDTLVC